MLSSNSTYIDLESNEGNSKRRTGCVITLQFECLYSYILPGMTTLLQVYLDIVEAIDQAREASNAAFSAATDAYRRVQPLERADQPDESDLSSKSLKIQSEVFRIRSQDLLQEAEGLSFNADNMVELMNELKVQWNIYKMR